MTRQHVILCEGYDDRAFWAGWLLHLGCRDPAGSTTAGRRPAVYDAWGEKVTGGRFLFEAPSGSKILVEPFHGASLVRRTAEIYILGQTTKPVDRMIINLDSDVGSETTAKDAHAVVRGIIESHSGKLDKGPPSSYDISGVQVCPVIWECPDDNAPGIPGQQTLERLVSAAICSAYPGRGSYFAKWYAEHGHDDFYRALWRDEVVATELKVRLRTSGAWQHVESMVSET